MTYAPAQIAVLLEKATKGPWTVVPMSGHPWCGVVHDLSRRICRMYARYPANKQQAQADAALIAAAPTIIAELLDRVKELEGERDDFGLCPWCGEDVSDSPETDFPPDPITGPETYVTQCGACEKDVAVTSYAVVKYCVAKHEVIP